MDVRDSSPEEPYTLGEIVRAVESRQQTLTLFSATSEEAVVETIREYFGKQNVEVGKSRTARRVPKNFAVLHRGEAFQAASPLREVYEAVKRDSTLLDVDDPTRIDYPEVLREIDHSVFTAYGKRRMIVASRHGEERAWRGDGGRLLSGFQEFSRVPTQAALYAKLAGRIETHVYGVPDAEVDIEGLGLHGHDERELARHWFVVYDAPEDREKWALLAEEREPNRYAGFWTGEPSVTDAIVDRLEHAFPETGRT